MPLFLSQLGASALVQLNIVSDPPLLLASNRQPPVRVHRPGTTKEGQGSPSSTPDHFHRWRGLCVCRGFGEARRHDRTLPIAILTSFALWSYRCIAGASQPCTCPFPYHQPNPLTLFFAHSFSPAIAKLAQRYTVRTPSLRSYCVTVVEQSTHHYSLQLCLVAICKVAA